MLDVQNFENFQFWTKEFEKTDENGRFRARFDMKSDFEFDWMDGWIDGWMDGWMDGCKSHVKVNRLLSDLPIVVVDFFR